MKDFISGALACLLCFAFTAFDASAQKHPISDITRVNLGDGRWLHRELESAIPLEGQHRIIDGYRSEYIDAVFSGGLYDGAWESYKYNVLVEKGSYSGGRKNGMFTKYTASGKLDSETPYTYGRVDGVVKTYYIDGSLQKEKGWKNGSEHGPDRAWKYGETEPTHDWNFTDGAKDGRQFTRVRSNQSEYFQVEYYKNGVLSGEYSETWANGNIRKKGSYENGKAVGVWVSHRLDGKQDGYMTFREGLKHGLGKTFFDDGTVESTTEWANDKREGVERRFDYESGELSSEFRYSDGERHGAYTRRYSDGTVTEGIYDKGVEIERKQYHSNGQLSDLWRLDERGRFVLVESYEKDGTPVTLFYELEP